MIGEYLSKIPVAEVRTIICPDISEELARLELLGSETGDGQKIVAFAWTHLPEVQKLIDDTITALGRVALAIWPNWYGCEVAHEVDEEQQLKTVVAGFHKATSLVNSKQPLSLPWLKAATSYCLANSIPSPRGFANEIQVSQLALAIDLTDIIILLVIEESDPDQNSLRGFAKMAEWLAVKSQAKIAVLIPQCLSTNKALDSISYQADIIAEPSEIRRKNKGDEGTKQYLWPLLGRPHPFSPGEQALARWLAGDERLAGLFAFNQRVRTVKDSSYIVDLLWPEGKLVVEIDGFKFHGSRYAFGYDRNKDYELALSGYAVLRMPHDEVMADVLLAVEKIGSMVNYCRNKLTDP